MRLENLCQEEIYIFLHNLSVEYNLEIGELHYMWDLFNYKNEESDNSLEKSEKIENESDNSLEKEYKKEKYKKCRYIYTRGDKINKECNSKILDSSCDYCSKHNKHNKHNKNNKNKEEKTTNINPNDIIIQLNKKINKYVHTETGYVFFSKEKIVVYCRLVDGMLLELSEEDIAICKLYRFKTDKSLYNKEL
jgi:hypothetical protein